MQKDKKIKQAVEGVYYGDIADNISKNMKYALGGIAIGALVGVFAASLFGKNRIVFGLAGAGIAGTAGYLCTPKKMKNE
jgi:ABC-type nitrate/sulfonate/bicarbonate transport system permease component